MVYDNGMELEKFHKEGGPFPDYLDREFVILLEASSGEGQSTLLVLPDSPARLERLLCRTGIRDSPHFWIVDSTLPGEVIRSIPAERLSINGLNRLCQAVERIAPEDLKTLVQLLADKDHPSQGAIPGRAIHVNRGERIYRKKSLSGRSMNWFPRPDPVTTEALYRLAGVCVDREWGGIDMLTALRVVARNFEKKPQRTTQDTHKQHTPPTSEPPAPPPPPQARRPPAEAAPHRRRAA